MPAVLGVRILFILAVVVVVVDCRRPRWADKEEDEEFANLQWTEWYNAPLTKEGDDQSTDRLREEYGLNCTEVEEQECRTVGSKKTFSSVVMVNRNELYLFCTGDGIVCRNKDQEKKSSKFNDLQPCKDYEIRFMCSNSTSKFFGTEGSYIALGVGIAIIVPLVIVLVFQLRKAKRQEQERAVRIARGEIVEDRPPPTYEDLFGFGGSPREPTPPPARSGVTDELIEEEEEESEGVVNNGAENDSGNGSADGGDTNNCDSTAAEARVGVGALASAAVATLSGNGIGDTSVGVGALASAAVATLSGNGIGDTSVSQKSSSEVTPNGPVVSLDAAGVDSSNNEQSSSNSAAPPTRSSATIPASRPSTSNHSSPTRFPGMHVSPIHDMYNEMQEKKGDEIPPPTYEEALDILHDAEMLKTADADNNNMKS